MNRPQHFGGSAGELGWKNGVDNISDMNLVKPASVRTYFSRDPRLASPGGGSKSATSFAPPARQISRGDSTSSTPRLLKKQQSPKSPTNQSQQEQRNGWNGSLYLSSEANSNLPGKERKYFSTYEEKPVKRELKQQREMRARQAAELQSELSLSRGDRYGWQTRGSPRAASEPLRPVQRQGRGKSFIQLGVMPQSPDFAHAYSPEMSNGGPAAPQSPGAAVIDDDELFQAAVGSPMSPSMETGVSEFDHPAGDGSPLPASSHSLAYTETAPYTNGQTPPQQDADPYREELAEIGVDEGAPASPQEELPSTSGYQEVSDVVAEPETYAEDDDECF